MHRAYLLGLVLLMLLNLKAFSVSTLDLDLAQQNTHQELLSQMEALEPQLLPGVQLLWQGVLGRNATIQMALQKIAEKSAQGKPKNKTQWTQDMLQGVVRLGGYGGSILTGSPVPMLGTSTVGRIMESGKAARRLTEISSADIVILSREVEKTQSDLLSQYVQYLHQLEDISLSERQITQLTGLWAEKAIYSNTPQNPFIGQMHQALLKNQLVVLEEARNRARTIRQLLVLAAGEDAIKAVDQLTAQVYGGHNKQDDSVISEPAIP
jgi:hypothetical protein